MKRLILLAALLSVPAYATNLMYARTIDKITKRPSIIYLTDTHSASCYDQWYVEISVDERSGDILPSYDACWAIPDKQGMFAFKVPAIGYFGYEKSNSYFAVPGASHAADEFALIGAAVRTREGPLPEETQRLPNPHP